MDFRHELVLPDEDLPFKLFVFEGKDGSYQVSRHWHRSVEIFLVLELRTQAGYRLLMNTEMAVGEIALECGFPDGRSFSKAFRRRYGMAPAAYRKKRKAPPGLTGQKSG